MSDLIISSIAIMDLGYIYDVYMSKVSGGRVFHKEGSAIGVDKEGTVRIDKADEDGYFSRVFTGHVRHKEELKQVLCQKGISVQ